MDKALLNKVLFTALRVGKAMTVTVTGESMEPTMKNRDTVAVSHSPFYEIGDVLVFLYKGELLIHRLLKIENGRYFCKGDNSFRLEDVLIDDIAGKVTLLNNAPLPNCCETTVMLSYLVNRAFRKNGYNAEKTKQSGIFRFYHQTLWNIEDKTMKYKKNVEMDYIPADDTSLAVFDPESGNTHFFDETGIDILNCLDEPCNLDALLDKLCDIYDATPDDIKADVLDFLTECIAKKVIEVI